MVVLAIRFCSVEFFTRAWREAHRTHHDIGRSANLFHRQQFTAENIFAGRELLANAGTEQLTQNCHEKMSMDASPAAAFEVIQTKFFFCFPEAVFHRPASEGHAKKLPQRPSVSTRHTVRQEVFCFIGEYVAGHNQRALSIDEIVRVILPPAGGPANLPDLAAAMRVLDAIMLRRLFTKRG